MPLPAWLKLMKGTLSEDDDEPVELLFSDQISSDPFLGGISAKEYGQALAMIPRKKRIKMMMNCIGGEVGDGTSMYHMTRSRGNVDVCIIGYSASMGSILAQAGAKRTMCAGTIMMIHNPSGYPGYAEEKDLLAQAAVLKKLKSGMVDIYQEHTGLSKKKISDLMDATTFMDPKEALENGFIDEIEDSGAATASMSPKAILTTYRQLTSAPKCVVDDESGTPAQENKTKTSMKLLTAALAKLGLVASADLTDEQAIITDLTARYAPIKASADAVTGLRTELSAHAAALKLRVEGRVQKAIDDKKIKAERKEVLINMGLSNEASLDFLDDIIIATAVTPPAPGRRGAPPVPAKPGTDTPEAQLLSVREEMSTEKDPVALAKLALKARALRGDGDMFEPTPFIPASKAVASVVAK